MRIEGTGIQADSFSRLSCGRACPVLLSHYHQDHMKGLEGFGRSGGREAGPVYCSEITARLLTCLDGVASEGLRIVKPGELFDARPDVRVTALDANHCLGSLMFLIESRGRRVLYTGDFRLDDAIRKATQSLAGLDLLYVDSTYDQPHYRFPPQDQAVAQVLECIKRSRARVINVATYTVGKDRILEAIHAEFGEPIYTTERKHDACVAMGLGHLVTRDKGESRFRAYSRGYLERYFRMSREYRSGDSLVIVPTGWAVDADGGDPCYRYVPYSEHCDYDELVEFKRLVRARKVIPL